MKRMEAVAMLARILLACGRSDEGLAAAREALSTLHEVGSDERAAQIHLVYAESLAAGGNQREAAAAIAVARDGLLSSAARISDPGWHERFLKNVPDNALILELARKWVDEAGMETSDLLGASQITCRAVDGSERR
jgi:hypothetical protein